MYEAFRTSITAPNADPVGDTSWMARGTAHHRLNSTVHGAARSSIDRTRRTAGRSPRTRQPTMTNSTVSTAISNQGGLSARYDAGSVAAAKPIGLIRRPAATRTAMPASNPPSPIASAGKGMGSQTSRYALNVATSPAAAAAHGRRTHTAARYAAPKAHRPKHSAYSSHWATGAGSPTSPVPRNRSTSTSCRIGTEVAPAPVVWWFHRLVTSPARLSCTSGGTSRNATNRRQENQVSV